MMMIIFRYHAQTCRVIHGTVQSTATMYVFHWQRTAYIVRVDHSRCRRYCSRRASIALSTTWSWRGHDMVRICADQRWHSVHVKASSSVSIGYYGESIVVMVIRNSATIDFFFYVKLRKGFFFCWPWSRLWWGVWEKKCAISNNNWFVH
jgi:hypothetical protein